MATPGSIGTMNLHRLSDLRWSRPTAWLLLASLLHACAGPEVAAPRTGAQAAASRSPADRYIRLEWTASDDPRSDGYHLYYRGPGDARDRRLWVESNIYRFPVRKPGRYRFQVTALNDSGRESPRSAVIEIDVPGDGP